MAKMLLYFPTPVGADRGLPRSAAQDLGFGRAEHALPLHVL